MAKPPVTLQTKLFHAGHLVHQPSVRSRVLLVFYMLDSLDDDTW
ncbi:hypothetical protein [Levilactobacillus sp. N40-8-2]